MFAQSTPRATGNATVPGGLPVPPTRAERRANGPPICRKPARLRCPDLINVRSVASSHRADTPGRVLCARPARSTTAAPDRSRSALSHRAAQLAVYQAIYDSGAPATSVAEAGKTRLQVRARNRFDTGDVGPRATGSSSTPPPSSSWSIDRRFRAVRLVRTGPRWTTACGTSCAATHRATPEHAGLPGVQSRTGIFDGTCWARRPLVDVYPTSIPAWIDVTRLRGVSRYVHIAAPVPLSATHQEQTLRTTSHCLRSLLGHRVPSPLCT